MNALNFLARIFYQRSLFSLWNAFLIFEGNFSNCVLCPGARIQSQSALMIHAGAVHQFPKANLQLTVTRLPAPPTPPCDQFIKDWVHILQPKGPESSVITHYCKIASLLFKAAALMLWHLNGKKKILEPIFDALKLGMTGNLDLNYLTNLNM